MSKLSWNDVGTKYFEAGVDRGVLYIDDTGVAWSGLTSVEEAPTGGAATPYYLDGVKFLNMSSIEEFEATLNAFYSPEEFDACDGSLALAEGLYVTAQKRKAFGLCYRTRIGNDVNGEAHGYKLHLVYNALASPSNNTHSTIADQVEAGVFSWKLTTTPAPVPAYRPTAHVVIDSTQTSPALLALLEENLYGTDTTPPTLIYPSRLIDLFNDYGILDITILADGRYAAQGWTVETLTNGKFDIDYYTVVMIGDGLFEVSGVNDTQPVELPGVFDVTTTGTTNYNVVGSAVTLTTSPPDSFNMNNGRVIDNGDGSLTITDTITTSQLIVETTGTTDFAVDGTGVELLTANEYAVTDASVIDNGDGTMTIL